MKIPELDEVAAMALRNVQFIAVMDAAVVLPLVVWYRYSCEPLQSKIRPSNVTTAALDAQEICPIPGFKGKALTTEL